MSKVVDATCNAAGIVTADGVPVTDAVILSQGKASSSGVLLIEELKSTYVTSNATDIKALITNVKAIVDKITSIVTSLNAATPGTPATADIALLVTLNTQLDLTKELLK